MTSLIFAAVFALLVGFFCLVFYGETDNEFFMILAMINFALGLIDLVVSLFNI